MKKSKEHISPFERAKDPEVRRRIDAKVREYLLSDILVEEMKKQGLSVRKLAKYANVSPATIQSIRDGEAENIGLGKLDHILSFVGRTIDFPAISEGRARSTGARACP